MMGRRARSGYWPVAALAASTAACAVAPPPVAQPPARRNAWSAAATPSPVVDAHDQLPPGINVLRAPGPGRVRLMGATFTMGTSPAGRVMAIELCRRTQTSPNRLNMLCGGEDERMASMLRTVLLLEMPAHSVTLSPFAIDRTEVSVGEYFRCVDQGACSPPAFDRGDGRFDRPELPVTHVRVIDAAQYCGWAGGRLPTEAEWEYAARGTTSRIFPWGQQWSSRRANHGSFDEDETDASDGYAFLAPVDALPDGATPTGILNLAGNVSEWVSDLIDIATIAATRTEEQVGYSPEPVTNPQGAENGERLTRGGSYRLPAVYLRSTTRWRPRRPYGNDVGFRCAYRE